MYKLPIFKGKEDFPYCGNHGNSFLPSILLFAQTWNGSNVKNPCIDLISSSAIPLFTSDKLKSSMSDSVDKLSL